MAWYSMKINFFRAAQGCFLGLQRLAGVAVERHICVVIGGVARAVLQIAGVVAGDAVRVGAGRGAAAKWVRDTDAASSYFHRNGGA